MHDWVVCCKSKKGAEEIRSFELSGKEFLFNYDETKSKEGKNKKNGSKKKAHRGLLWQELRQKEGTVSYEDRKSTWNSGVRKAIRQGSAEEEVCKHRDRETGAWKQISKQRRRVDVSCDPSMVPALQHGTWMDEEGFKKTCIREKEKKRRHPPAFVRYMGSRLHAETACRQVYTGEVSE